LEGARRMTIPKGVTIRKHPDEPRPVHNPGNILWAAANAANRADAERIIIDALRLGENRSIIQHTLSEQGRWKRLDTSSRLMELGDWIKGECYELMDLITYQEVSTLGD
jgi:hypothetical protein